ncbi:MAG: lasso peptide biosynthesis B2 protein [Candidatus Electrothrix sp. AW3_4]|nr:lasso peptide biosynthesis B2 protein [Candidatus Electrothrix gigas]
MRNNSFLVLKRKVISFLNFSGKERFLFLEAYLLLGLAWTAIRIVPFKVLSRYWGIPHAEGLRTPPTDRLFLRQISQALHTASRYTPWNSNCLCKALAAKTMLRRRGYTITLYLGMHTQTSSPTNTTEAHAWLRCGDTWICGYRASQGFTVVATFSESQETVTG